MMIAFRKAHPTLCRSRFWRDDVRWFGTGPEVDMSQGSRHLAFYLDGASEQDDDLYVMINSGTSPRTFTIQEGEPHEWQRVVDTSRSSPHDIRLPGSEISIRTSEFPVKSRSVVVLIRKR